MKVVILAGGLGTRISEESQYKPKPMVEIDGKPILWHIMKYYSSFGHNDFIICCGYKGNVIKEFFANYYLNTCDLTFDLQDQSVKYLNNTSEPWKVTLIDTGLNTMTGGRIKRIKKYVGDETFFMTYGDGVSDVDLNKLLKQHQKSKNVVTLTATQKPERFGILSIKEGNVKSFKEKDPKDSSWINGGYMVMEPEVFKYIKGDQTVFEKDPLETLVKEGKLGAYKHNGFWQCMDTLRDKKLLEGLYESGNAPWKVWND